MSLLFIELLEVSMCSTATAVFQLSNFFFCEYAFRKMEQDECHADWDIHAGSLEKAFGSVFSPEELSIGISLLLDCKFLSDDTDGNYLASQDQAYVSFEKKCKGLKLVSTMMQDVYDRLSARSECLDAINYFYALSQKYGVYASRLKVFRNKSYPKANFERSLLSSISEIPFYKMSPPLQRQSGLLSFDPNELIRSFEPTGGRGSEVFSYLENKEFATYCPKMSGFFIEVNSSIDLPLVLSEITRDLTEFVVEYKAINDLPLTTAEEKLFLNNDPLLKESQFSADGAQSRLIGLKMWDLMHYSKTVTQKAAYDELIQNNGIYGSRSQCSNVTFDMCLGGQCPSQDTCYRYISQLYKAAKQCVDVGKICSTKPTKKKVSQV